MDRSRKVESPNSMILLEFLDNFILKGSRCQIPILNSQSQIKLHLHDNFPYAICDAVLQHWELWPMIATPKCNIGAELAELAGFDAVQMPTMDEAVEKIC